MKITWFGGTVFRIYIGGQILLVDGAAAPASVNHEELRAGADVTLDLQSQLSTLPFLGDDWRPASQQRMIDQPAERPVALYRLAGNALFVEGEGEVLILGGTESAVSSRCVDGAVVVLVGEDSPLAAMQSLLAMGQPRLLLLAAVQPKFDGLAEIAGNMSIIAMETGLAIEA